MLAFYIKILPFLILIKNSKISHSYGNGLLQASDDVAFSDLEGLNPGKEFVEAFIHVGSELVDTVLDFVAFDLVEI